MIWGNIGAYTSQLGGYSEKLKDALAFIRDADFQTMNKGRTDIHGDDMYAMLFEGTTKPESELKAEEHIAYTDIHYVVAGEERIGYAPQGSVAAVVQDLREQDALLYEHVENETFVHLREGDFLVLFPGEIHRTWVCAGECSPLTKLVIKIKL